MANHFDLSEADKSTYSVKDVSLLLFPSALVGGDALKVVCQSCLETHRVASPGAVRIVIINAIAAGRRGCGSFGVRSMILSSNADRHPPEGGIPWGGSPLSGGIGDGRSEPKASEEGEGEGRPLVPTRAERGGTRNAVLVECRKQTLPHAAFRANNITPCRLSKNPYPVHIRGATQLYFLNLRDYLSERGHLLHKVRPPPGDGPHSGTLICIVGRSRLGYCAAICVGMVRRSEHRRDSQPSTGAVTCYYMHPRLSVSALQMARMRGRGNT